jgi:outer membrane protein TolC
MAAFLAGAAMAAGCSSAFYTKQADREVYGIVAQKDVKAFGKVREFSIQRPVDLEAMLKGLSERGKAAPAAILPSRMEAPGFVPVPVPDPKLPPPIPEPSPDAVCLTVADALRIAAAANRDYQTARETAYLTALTLTFERYLFRPHPFATGTVNFENNADTGEHLKQWNASADIGASQQLADGMVIVGSLGLTALKFINRELGDTVGSTLDFSLTQPLWRGAGRLVVQENLTQAERNALYAVRSLARFEQEFAVGIASQYLRVLQDRDVVINEWRNYRSLFENRERAEWLAKAERMPEFQVDQARQDELRAYNNWIVTRENYANSLDNFKVLLGIPVEWEISLEPKELDRLVALGLQHPDTPLKDAEAESLEQRFDLVNARGGIEDAQRKILVAENGLAGDVDLVASIGYASDSSSPQSARLQFRKGDYAVGLNLALPVDRLRERNALRQTQITRDRAGRSLTLLEDQIILEVRRALRRLEQARESYEIQKRAVALAERRVESTQLLLQAGRADQRDVLDAQQALVDARNALTSALVDHTIANLEFQRDVGTLVVDEEGQIHGWKLTERPGSDTNR